MRDSGFVEVNEEEKREMERIVANEDGRSGGRPLSSRTEA
jgi:hypothetical protein